MLEQPPSESRRRSWLWVAALTTALYAGIFVARILQHFIEQHFGRTTFLVIVLAAIAAAALFVFGSARRRPASVLWLVVVAAAYAVGAWRLRHSPEEALHFVEYGALSALIFRAYSHRMHDPLIYPAAALLGGILGSLDEIIQYFVPARFFDFRDLAINAAAVALMQAAIALSIRPAFVRAPVSEPSVRTVSRLATAGCFLLLLCFSNTLQRQTWFLKNMPHPAYMERMNDVMVEYGKRHHSPDGAIFFSRLSIDQMREQDATNAAANAAILDRYAGTNGYKRFQFEISQLDYPLAYEARVRLFRRDKHAGEAIKLRHTPDRARYAATIAFQENRLAEWLYPQLLTNSSYVLREDWQPFIQSLADRESSYESPVGNQLFTRLSERQAQTSLACGMILSMCLPIIYRRHKKQPASVDGPFKS